MHWNLGSSSPSRILAAIAAVVCLVASVSAQQIQGSISGAVVDSLGGRVAGARVADQAVRENPYQAVAIGVGVGLLAGYLLGRRGSRNND